jgi:cation diffusion facilitator family transporter
VWAGYPLADPIVGLVISAAILVLVWQSARVVIVRMLDGVDPEVTREIAHAAGHAPRVEEVSDVRARWVGHRLHVDVSVTVPGGLSVAQGHDVARAVRHQLLHHLPHLGRVMVHVDPYGQGGERHHRIGAHAHDGMPAHTHD